MNLVWNATDHDPLFLGVSIWVNDRPIFHKTIVCLTFTPRSVKRRAARWGLQSDLNPTNS